ncbi:MAG: thiamine pyrophosphate-binding protein [Myxococcales bacterium]|nr:thiamine pyrophosphate-binding protein [Myxococcales bacterium]
MTRSTARQGSDPRPDVRRAASAIVEALEDAGIDRVFGIPGGAISPLNDALLDSALEHVTCQHETMAVHMAAGYARATGRPGVVMVTSGPGTLNALTGVAAAYLDEAPVLLLAGDVASTSAGRGALQDGGADGLAVANIFASVTKMIASLEQPLRAGAITRRALHRAMLRPRGPVLLRVPVDIAQLAAPSSELGEALSSNARASEETLRRAAHALSTARRPLLLLGVGAREAGAREAVLDLAELHRIPVASDLEAKGVMPESHPLWLGIIGVGSYGGARAYLDNVDALLTVGCRLDDTLTGGYSPSFRPRNGTLIQIDHAPLRMGRAFEPDLPLCGDIEDTLKRLFGIMHSPSAELVVARDGGIRAAQRDMSSPTNAHMEKIPFAPHAVISALQRYFPDDTVYTTDVGNHLLFSVQHLRIAHDDAFYAPYGLGAMTSGIGVAMGLALGHASRGRRVVAICGDGGMLMGGNEIATCALRGVPVTLVVFNDGQLGMVQHGNERVFGRSLDLRTPPVDLCGYAEALGARVRRVRCEDDIAWAASATLDGPLLLDIPIDPAARASNPRESAVSFPADQRQAS